MPDLNTVANFLRDEFPQFGGSVVEISAGTAKIRYEVTEKDLRPGGTVSGPAMMSVADAAIYAAILGTVGVIPLAVTTSLSMNFLRRPQSDTALLATCELVKTGKRLVVGEVRLYSEGSDDIIAMGSGTYALPPP